MNTTTNSEFPDQSYPNQTSSTAGRLQTTEPHLIVQILSVIAFGIVSIVGVALAFTAFWLAGLVLTIVILSIWAKSGTFSARRYQSAPQAAHTIPDLAPAVSLQRSSGNSSFDAYRTDMLKRLEQENRDFEDFLIRLRKASDAKEFDKFMDDRAAKTNETSPGPYP